MQECLENPETTEEEIMAATYRALTKHGYSQLSIQNIADEFEKSKSLLYHHYSGKDEILRDFMDHLMSCFEEQSCFTEVEGPRNRLEKILFEPLDRFRGGNQEFLDALTELRVQAVRDEDYREKVSQNLEFFTENIEEVLEKGQEQEVFKSDFEPRKTALFLFTLVSGALTLEATTGEDIQAVKAELRNFLEQRVYV